MKRILTLALLLATAICLSAQEPIQVKSKGSIDPKTWKAGQTATLSISRMPETLDEFVKLQAEIGSRPEGAVMLQVVAFQMYIRNKTVGTEAIKLNNTDINHYSVLSRMPEIFRLSGDSYARLHLPATFFDGATPENGFNPKQPYTITVRSSKTRNYERSESLKGYVLYLEAYSTGYDTPWRGCDVVKQKGCEYYKVNSSPSMYVQCKEVPFDSERDYEGLK